MSNTKKHSKLIRIAAATATLSIATLFVGCGGEPTQAELSEWNEKDCKSEVPNGSLVPNEEEESDFCLNEDGSTYTIYAWGVDYR